MALKLGMTLELCMAYNNMLMLDARSQWVGRGKTEPVLNYLDNQASNNKHYTLLQR